MSHSIKIYDKLAKYYSLIFKLQNPKSHLKQEIQFLHKILQKNGRPKSVIDIGCGMGRISDALQQKGYSVTGVDGSLNMLKLAKKKYPRVKFVQSRFDKFSISADAAISWWTTYTYLSPAEFKRFVIQLHKNVDLVVLDSSNYPVDKRPKTTFASINEKGLTLKQERTWYMRGNTRYLEYLYTIGKEKISYTDISYWYSLTDLMQLFKDKFELIATYGDYVEVPYDEKVSPRLVTVWRKRTTLAEKLSKIKLFLFDFAGIIVDTEKIEEDTAAEVLKRYEIIVTEKEKNLFAGKTNEAYFTLILHKYGKFSKPLLKEIIAVYVPMILQKTKRAPLCPGVKTLLQKLNSKGMKMAIVSGNDASFIQPLLAEHDIAKYFDAVVSAGDYKESKPAPTPYLTAAKRLRMAPSECVVIEDAESGTLSAKAAGMLCIGVRTSTGQDLSRADFVTDSLYDISRSL